MRPFAVAVSLVMVTLIPTFTSAGEGSEFYVVWTPGGSDVQVPGLATVAEYGAFVLKEGRLRAGAAPEGIEIERVPTLLQKGAVAIDVRAANAAVALGEGYAVVRFVGPVHPDWQAWLEGQVEILDYVPFNGFVVRGGSDALNGLRDHPWVDYVGPYTSEFKLHPALPRLGTTIADVQLWQGSSVEAFSAAAPTAGAAILAVSDAGPEPYARLAFDAVRLDDVARLDAVAWVEPVRGGDPYDNNEAAWVTQSGVQPLPAAVPGLAHGRSVHNGGLSGAGQYVSVADGGIDSSGGSFIHEMFDDPTHGPYAFGQANPNHRKVAAYFRLTEGSTIRGDFVGNQHGTHTSGSATGDAPNAGAYGTYNNFDGQGFGAKLVVMDWFALPVDYFNMFDPTYQVGARLHSNSYGYPHDITYNLRARQNDLYSDTHPDFLIFRSAGNTAGNTIRPEATAKDVVTSGATQNGGSFQNLASFSSRGPTQDGRVKPTFVAPGEDVMSSNTGGGYASLSGTSMSTPTSAGAAALVRQYYQEGWYPAGVPGSSTGFNPSSALVRATMINSATPITGQNTARPGLTSAGTLTNVCAGTMCVDNATKPNWPNGDMGWGILRLDNALVFPNDGHKIFVQDGTTVGTGATLSYPVTVANAAAGLKIVVAWTDAAAAVGANPSLVNDLDLVVTTPDGTTIRGNVFAGLGSNNVNLGTLGLGSGQVVQAQSVPGGTPDRRNVEEVFVQSAPLPGTYTVSVVGANVPTGAQAFALVVTGGLA